MNRTLEIVQAELKLSNLLLTLESEYKLKSSESAKILSKLLAERINYIISEEE